MTRSALFRGGFGALVILVLGGAPAHAQTRTWVSGIGNDSGTCTITAPCATFAYAYTQTATGGEISVLSPGGYGSLTINHAISIINDGVGETGVLVSSGNGITVAAGPTDVVILRGIVFDGIKTGAYGVELTSGGTLSIQNCAIQGFASAALYVTPTSGTTTVKIQDTTIIENFLGVQFKPTSGAIVNASIDRSRIDYNTNLGVKANGNGGGPVTVSIANSSISLNGLYGLNTVSGSSGNVAVDLTGVVLASNGQNAIQSNAAGGGTSTVTIGSSMLSNNGGAVGIVGGAAVLSYANNQVTGPLGSGFSSTVGLQ